jgi:2-phospho-L-lactate transferase/gluconeogenesis factor (CofD/UPF0052 family)
MSDFVPALKVAFISGGTALQSVSKYLGYLSSKEQKESNREINIQHYHLITCFDSGGSSFTLRAAFRGLPAVGDLRNRLHSLTQGSLCYFPNNRVCCFQLSELLGCRLPSSSNSLTTNAVLRSCLIKLLMKFSELAEGNRVCDANADIEAKIVALVLLLSGDSNDSMTVMSDDLPPFHLDANILQEALSSSSQIFTEQEADWHPQAMIRHDDLLSHLYCTLNKVPNASLFACGFYLQQFLLNVPENFDYFGASIGNLILTGAYFTHSKDLVSAVSKVGTCLGITTPVIPTSVDDCTLGAQLDNGRVVIGQHYMTFAKEPQVSKSARGIDAPVTEIFLVDMWESIESGDLDSVISSVESVPSSIPSIVTAPVATAMSALRPTATATEASLQALQSAEVICYSVGSFYTSLIASVLPAGIGRAIALNSSACKVYVPNMQSDPEMLGMSLHSAVEVLCNILARDVLRGNGASDTTDMLKCQPDAFISVVLVDKTATYAQYSGSGKEDSKDIICGRMNIQVVEEDICSQNDGTNKLELDPIKFLNVISDLGEKFRLAL